MGNLIFRASVLEMVMIITLSLLVTFFIFKSQHAPKKFLNRLALVLKVLAVSLISFLLLKPEVKKELTRENDLELLVLKDRTPSMKAKDLFMEGDDLSREEGISAFLSSEEWITFQSKTDFTIKERSFGEEVEETDLNAALQQAEGASALLLLTDGAWNAGESPLEMAQKLRRSGVSVFSLALGKESPLPDFSIEKVEAPLIVETEEIFVINALLKSTFPAPHTAQVYLKSGEEILEDRMIEFSGSESKEMSFTLEITEEGTTDYSVEVKGADEEATLENNQMACSVSARSQTINVLLVDTFPRWEYRFIRNAMMRDVKVNVSCLLLHPELSAGEGPNYIQQFPEDLSSYDVILLGDIGISEKQLSEENVTSIIEAVKKNATGLMLLPGRNGWQRTLYENADFTSLYPVEVIDDFSGTESNHQAGLKLSEEGQGSLLLSLTADERKNAKIWSSLPGFNCYQPVSGIKSGAVVLAYHDTDRNKKGRIPIMVIGKSGRGKVLWMGMDSSWKWRRGVEDLYHYRYWRQVARWMAYQRNLTEGEQAKIFLSTESPKEGGSLSFSLHAMTADGKPAVPESIRFTSDFNTGSESLIPLMTTKNWGKYKGEVKLAESGLLTLKVVVDGEEVGKREIQVAAKKKETIGEPADYASLNEISRLTNGVSLPFQKRLELLPLLSKAESPPPRYEFQSLNKEWFWFMLILLLLLTSWILRRISTGE